MPTPNKSSAKAPKGKLKAKTESQILLKSFPDRSGFGVWNPSSKEVWLALGETATKEEGIWLKKESGAIIIEGYTGPVACVTSAEEGEITYAEW